MLELDFIFEQFIKYGLKQLTTEELHEFQKFLDNQDPDLFAWFLGYQQPEKDHDKVWVERVLAAQKPQ
jgi:antitoxin CptB